MASEISSSSTSTTSSSRSCRIDAVSSPGCLTAIPSAIVAPSGLRPASGAVPMGLLIVIGFKHALDGMKVVVDDYVHEEGNRFFLNTLLLFLAVNAMVLGRDLANMVAARHFDRAARRQWLAQNRGQRLLLGGITTALFLVPVVNLVAPVVGAAMATHLFHGRA